MPGPSTPDNRTLTAARAYLEDQARIAHGFGSPFVATLLAAGARYLPVAPRTAAMFIDWPGDRASAALALRFHAALHALARAGAIAPLAALFHGTAQDADAAVLAALRSADAFIADRMRHPTQTNEVGRTGAIAAALLVLHDRLAQPFELLEIGASAGLNLNLGRYRYDLGGIVTGHRASPLTIAPTWEGARPPDGEVPVMRARGVDLSPIAIADPASCERLIDHLFVDQPHRIDRLTRAITIARDHPPQVDSGAAGQWLPEELARPQASGRCRVVIHSMVMQYLSIPERAAVAQAIDAAGAAATLTRPLARIGLEWTETRDAVHLTLTQWPGGVPEVLAACDPYGAWVRWRG